MNKSQLLQKLNEIEWEDFECKSARNALPKSIWETVSAFSNTLGGWIVLGIQQKGKQFNPVGVSDPEKIEQDFLNTLNNHKFNIRIHPKSRVYNIDSKIILAFFIPPSSKKPVYYHSPANTFIRTGSSNRKASNEEIDAMFRDQSFGLKGEEFIQGTSIEDLSFLSVDQYMGYMKKQNPALEYNRLSASDFLQKTKVIIGDKITYSGLLFFGKRDSIDRYFSDFRIDLFEIPGTSYKNASPRYTYRLPEQENIWEYYFLLFQRITHSIEQPFRMNEKGFGTGLYPQIEALREALVNMLMHADYFSTIKSRIRLFSDRIEFSNPGCFPKSIEELKKSDISILRNPIIAKLFRIVKLAENAGFGFDKMIKG